MAKKKKPQSSLTTTIGGALVGLDYAILKAGKPPAEQVESAKPQKPVAADDGGTLTIALPEDGPPDADEDRADLRASRPRGPR